MENNSDIITPNEINKYLYCPYQWYYERLFGKKKLRELYKKRNEELGYVDSAKSNFVKGLKFHSNYVFFDRLKRVIKLIFLVLVVVAIVYLYYEVLK